MKRFQGELVFKADGLLYHSTLGSRVVKKKKRVDRLHYTTLGSRVMKKKKRVHRLMVRMRFELCPSPSRARWVPFFFFFIILKPGVE